MTPVNNHTSVMTLWKRIEYFLKQSEYYLDFHHLCTKYHTELGLADHSINSHYEWIMRSTHSIGTWAPRKLIWVAHLLGLERVVICDFSSVWGLREAHDEARSLGIKLEGSVELETEFPGLTLQVMLNDLPEFINIIHSDLKPAIKLRQWFNQLINFENRRTFLTLSNINKILSEDNQPLIPWYEVETESDNQMPYIYHQLGSIVYNKMDKNYRHQKGIIHPRDIWDKMAIDENSLLSRENSVGIQQVQLLFKDLPVNVEYLFPSPEKLLEHKKEDKIIQFLPYLLMQYNINTLGARNPEAEKLIQSILPHVPDLGFRIRHGVEFVGDSLPSAPFLLTANSINI